MLLAMATQPNIYVDGSENRPHMPSKGPPTSRLQTEDELTEAEAKQVEADDQAIHLLLLGLLVEIYAHVDSCDNAHAMEAEPTSGQPSQRLHDPLKMNVAEYEPVFCNYKNKLVNLKFRLIRVKSKQKKEESPCLTDKASQIQEHDSHSAKSSSSVGLTTAPKIVINSPCLNGKKELAILEQTATGKESTNPLMVDSLPKTIMPTKLVKPQGFNLRPNMGIQTPTKKLRIKP
ncbi:hypothetical protein Tco_0242740 [Tanacetum coccineum]